MKKATPERSSAKTLGQLLSRFNIKLHIKTPFLDVELEYTDADKSAAWELYVEMLTRIVTQPLHREHGSEQTALESVYSMFPTTREILKKHGPECAIFAKIAVPVLNQIVRPFTAKWHKLSLDDGLSMPDTREEFRCELDALRGNLLNYSRMLAELAGIKDLTDLEGDV